MNWWQTFKGTFGKELAGKFKIKYSASWTYPRQNTKKGEVKDKSRSTHSQSVRAKSNKCKTGSEKEGFILLWGRGQGGLGSKD
jgi:hypothetical protein